jgi:hypothetical protein
VGTCIVAGARDCGGVGEDGGSVKGFVTAVVRAA